jgi:TonB family protein
MKRSLIVSAVAHAIVFLAVFFMPRSPARWDRDDAIAVDLVGPVRAQSRAAAPPAPAQAAPEAPKSEPTPSETPPTETKEPAPPKETPKKRAPRQEPSRRFEPIAPPSSNEPSLEERLRQRLEEMNGESPSEPPPDANGAIPEAQDAGEGDSPTSTAEVSATDFPYAWYLNLLRTKISDAWDPPASRLLVGRTNQLIVRFRLARNGSVSDVDVEVVSGATGLDSSARRAVDRAQPFPPLPDGYPEDAVDIAVRFTVSEGKP